MATQIQQTFDVGNAMANLSTIKPSNDHQLVSSHGNQDAQTTTSPTAATRKPNTNKITYTADQLYALRNAKASKIKPPTLPHFISIFNTEDIPEDDYQEQRFEYQPRGDWDYNAGRQRYNDRRWKKGEEDQQFHGNDSGHTQQVTEQTPTDKPDGSEDDDIILSPQGMKSLPSSTRRTATTTNFTPTLRQKPNIRFGASRESAGKDVQPSAEKYKPPGSTGAAVASSNFQQLGRWSRNERDLSARTDRGFDKDNRLQARRFPGQSQERSNQPMDGTYRPSNRITFGSSIKDDPSSSLEAIASRSRSLRDSAKEQYYKEFKEKQERLYSSGSQTTTEKTSTPNGNQTTTSDQKSIVEMLAILGDDNSNLDAILPRDSASDEFELKFLKSLGSGKAEGNNDTEQSRAFGKWFSEPIENESQEESKFLRSFMSSENEKMDEAILFSPSNVPTNRQPPFSLDMLEASLKTESQLPSGNTTTTHAPTDLEKLESEIIKSVGATPKPSAPAPPSQQQSSSSLLSLLNSGGEDKEFIPTTKPPTMQPSVNENGNELMPSFLQKLFSSVGPAPLPAHQPQFNFPPQQQPPQQQFPFQPQPLPHAIPGFPNMGHPAPFPQHHPAMSPQQPQHVHQLQPPMHRQQPMPPSLQQQPLPMQPPRQPPFPMSPQPQMQPPQQQSSPQVRRASNMFIPPQVARASAQQRLNSPTPAQHHHQQQQQQHQQQQQPLPQMQPQPQPQHARAGDGGGGLERWFGMMANIDGPATAMANPAPTKFVSLEELENSLK